MVKRTGVISFPHPDPQQLDNRAELTLVKDSAETPVPSQCTYIFRRNFQAVFEKIYVAEPAPVEIAGLEFDKFYFLIRRNDWLDGSQTCFACFEFCYPCSNPDFKSGQLTALPDLLEHIGHCARVDLSKIPRFRIGVSTSPEFHDAAADLPLCAAFYHAAWIRLLSVEREQFGASTKKWRLLEDYLSSIANVRGHLSEIKIIFMSEERSSNKTIQAFSDQIQQRLKLRKRYGFLVEASDQLEKYASVSNVLRSLKTARAVTTTLALLSVLSVGFGIISQATNFSKNPEFAGNTGAVFFDPLFLSLIGQGLALAAGIFGAVFLLVRLVRKYRV